MFLRISLLISVCVCVLQAINWNEMVLIGLPNLNYNNDYTGKGSFAVSFKTPTNPMNHRISTRKLQLTNSKFLWNPKAKSKREINYKIAEDSIKAYWKIKTEKRKVIYTNLIHLKKEHILALSADKNAHSLIQDMMKAIISKAYQIS